MRIFRFTSLPLFLAASVAAVIGFAVAPTSAQAGASAIIARDEPAEGVGRAAGAAAGASGYAGTPKSATQRTKNNTTRSKTAAKTPAKTVAAKPKAWNGFVVGDKYTFLNFEVVSAEKPWHTREAKENGASGLVQVEVLIETNGNVIQAKGRTGNKLLHPEAERAALASKFNRPTFGGKPARAIGFLVYRFGPAED